MIRCRANIVRYLVNVTDFSDLLQTGFCSLREREKERERERGGGREGGREREVETEGPGLRDTKIYFLV